MMSADAVGHPTTMCGRLYTPRLILLQFPDLALATALNHNSPMKNHRAVSSDRRFCAYCFVVSMSSLMARIMGPTKIGFWSSRLYSVPRNSSLGGRYAVTKMIGV